MPTVPRFKHAAPLKGPQGRDNVAVEQSETDNELSQLLSLGCVTFIEEVTSRANSARVIASVKWAKAAFIIIHTKTMLERSLKATYVHASSYQY